MTGPPGPASTPHSFHSLDVKFSSGTNSIVLWVLVSRDLVHITNTSLIFSEATGGQAAMTLPLEDSKITKKWLLAAPVSSFRKLHVGEAWCLSVYLMGGMSRELRSYTGGTMTSVSSCGARSQ